MCGILFSRVAKVEDAKSKQAAIQELSNRLKTELKVVTTQRIQHEIEFSRLRADAQSVPAAIESKFNELQNIRERETALAASVLAASSTSEEASTYSFVLFVSVD